MAIGKGPDEIHELSQEIFTNMITGDVPFLVLLRKTEWFKSEKYTETDELYAYNKK